MRVAPLKNQARKRLEPPNGIYPSPAGVPQPWAGAGEAVAVAGARARARVEAGGRGGGRGGERELEQRLAEDKELGDGARGGGGGAERGHTFWPRFERSIRIVAIWPRSSLFSAFAARMVSRFCLIVHCDVS